MSDQTVGNILKRHGPPPAPERTKTLPWREFIRIHLAVLIATDFFTTEAWNRLRLVLSSCLMFVLCLNYHALYITAIAALRNTCEMLSRLRGCHPWHAAAGGRRKMGSPGQSKRVVTATPGGYRALSTAPPSVCHT
jgi:putative component of membrane protein insertase Oxa1/YidC/SpoIIIJ protein YidD